MTLRLYVIIWILFSGFLTYEYTALNSHSLPSVLQALAGHHVVPFTVSPEPGRALSLILGWAGLSLMIIMNVYSLRKRADFLKGIGRLASWLNFHVFCGLLGPTLILFHCNFKVRGLVAISFWSMTISFISGVIGRYFYLQIVMKKADFQKESEDWIRRLKKFLAKNRIEWDNRAHNPYMHRAVVAAGVPANRSTNAISIFALSIAGDWRLRVRGVPMPRGWPEPAGFALKQYALSVRRSVTLESYQQLMGYWHAFHFPFAIFMYVTAAIHVAASLIFSF